MEEKQRKVYECKMCGRIIEELSGEGKELFCECYKDCFDEDPRIANMTMSELSN